MKKTFNVFSVIALLLTVVGAVNWLSVGVFRFNVVSWITFGVAWVERLLYVLVGVAGLFMIVWLCVSGFRMVADLQEDRNAKYKRNQAEVDY